MEEEWRDIEEFKGLYQVSNYGRVRSIERRVNNRVYRSKILKQVQQNGGDWLMVHLRTKEGYVRRSVAKLVLITFAGNPPGMAVSAKHLDGNNFNNRLDNLKWNVCKAYYMPENEYARKLFEEDAQRVIDIYVSAKKITNAVNFGHCDVDDFKQMCLIRIWNDIDAYNSEFAFSTFCYLKCNSVFERLYKKERKRNKRMIYIEDMVTELRPLDHIAALGYIEDFEKYEPAAY